MITRLYELLTGRPWTTTRSMAAEYGPPPGAVYAAQLAAYTDAELIAHGKAILARLREQEAIAAWRRLDGQQQAETYWRPLPTCGCPTGVVVDEGHQEGCHRHTETTADLEVVTS